MRINTTGDVMKRIFSFVLACSLAVVCFNGISICGMAEGNNAEPSAAIVNEGGYENYLQGQSLNKAQAGAFIKGRALNQPLNSVKDSSGNEENECVNADNTGVYDYTFEVENAGLYNIYIKYFLPESTGKKINLSLKLNGKVPFYEAEVVELKRLYKDESNEVKKDAGGNEYVGNQIECGIFQETGLQDTTGIYQEPYLFAFDNGNSTVSLTFDISEKIIIAGVYLKAPDRILDYKEILDEYKQAGYTSPKCEPLIIEAEKAMYKTSRSLTAKSDSSSPDVTPSDPVKQLINYIGGSTWKENGDSISWLINVSEDGLYKIGFKYKQDQNINAFSYRSMKIDGKTPFKECENLKFDYAINWKLYEPGDESGNYCVYLTKGTHTLSLTCTLGETTQYYKQLKSVVSELGDMYIDIAMITGETPDANRDYNLFEQIPDFNNKLNKIRTDILGISDGLRTISKNNATSLITSLENMARVLKSMKDNPYTAHNYLKDYYSNYTTVSAWLYDMKSMPLSLDRIIVSPANNRTDNKRSGLLTRFTFGFKRFAASFATDYNDYSASEKGEKTLKIWVNWGRDQAMVLNSLITESFTPESGINVNLEITNAGLVKGILSNNAPDLSLQMARTEPVNLAMRNALVDLTEFSDYNDVISRFGNSASVPYTYGGGVYALPDTQSFYIMFYRSDILSQLGISVPKTWDEFLTAVSVLERNNMNAWIPYTQITTSSTVNIGVGGLNLFPSILQQFGGSLYNSELDGCDWDNDPIMLKAFSFWTGMYTKYKMPETLSFYNRFRVGTTPLGVDVYTNYNQLSQAAPEIDGRWGIALVPGIKNEDGSINHTVSGAGTGCAILKSSKNKEEAWEFLKWWTRADTQLAYNNGVESILGAVSRVTTATVEAFENMAWSGDDLTVLSEQRSYIQEVPEIPGSYYVSRSVDQAFWNVINKSQRPKDMLEKWGTVANQEIKRKIAEYAR